eukprot:1182420-Prorocentrum_minimum.AAC.3
MLRMLFPVLLMLEFVTSTGFIMRVVALVANMCASYGRISESQAPGALPPHSSPPRRASPGVDCRPANGSLSAGNIRRIFDGIFEMPCVEWYTSVDSRRCVPGKRGKKAKIRIDQKFPPRFELGSQDSES